MPNLSEIVFKKVCRTCLSCSEDMKSLYEASSSSTSITFAEMLMTFTPLKFFGYDGLPRHICHNCIGDLNRSYTFQLNCVESDTLLRKDIEKDVLSRGRNIFTGSLVGDHHVRIEMEDCIQINPPIDQVEIIQNSLNQITDGLITDNNSIGKLNEDSKIDMNKTKIVPRCKRRILSCKMCPKSFTQSSKLKAHIGYHTGIKPFMCTVCSSSFSKNRHLVSHHMLAHAPDNPEFSTTIEENPIKEHTTLQYIVPAKLEKIPELIAETDLHQDSELVNQDIDVEVNTGMESNNDRSCGIIKQTQFTSESSHTNSRSPNQNNLTNEMFSCLMCSKSFAQSNNLTAHIRNHTGAIPFECRVCNCKFTKYRSLANHHKRVHTAEKPVIVTKFEDNAITGHTKLQYSNNALATLHKIPLLIAEMQKDLHQESQLVNQDIDVDVNIEMESNSDRSCGINKKLYVPGNPFNSPIKNSEMQKDLNQELELLNPGVDNDKKVTPPINQVEIIQNTLTHNKSLNQITDGLIIDKNSKGKSNDCKFDMNKAKILSESSQTNSRSLNQNNLTNVAPSKEMVSSLVCPKSFAQRNNLLAHIPEHIGQLKCTICDYSCLNKRTLSRHYRRVHVPKTRTNFEENPRRELDRLRRSNIVPVTLPKMPVLIAKKQKVLHQVVNQDINVVANIEMKDHKESNNDRSCDTINQIYVPNEPLNTPLTFAETRKELNQELDLIGHKVEFDVNNKRNNLEIIAPMNQIEISEIHSQPLSKLNDSKIEDNTNAKYNDTYNSQDSKIEVNKTLEIHSDKRSLNQNNLTDDMQLHRKINSFSCTVCSRVFKHRRFLRVHVIKKHPGEKAYECTVCDTSFHNRHSLASHMLTHPEKKPHVCTVCGRAFTNKPQCLIHMHYTHNISI